MEIKEIIAALEVNTGKFPREALAEAISQKDAIIPELFKFIEFAKINAERIEKNEIDRMGHIYAFFLLAQFRERSAFAPIVDFFTSIPSETVFDITGDVITEDLGRILASVYDGDIAPVKKIIEDENIDEYIRSACLECLTTLVAVGIKTREEIVSYYTRLFHGGLKWEDSPIWDHLVCASADLHPEELYGDICKAYKEGLVSDCYISLKGVDIRKSKTIDAVLADLRNNHSHTLIADTIKEMEWWACFKNKSKPSREISERPILPVEKRNSPKIGRNDPCSCGSEKKYKKCCGK